MLPHIPPSWVGGVPPYRTLPGAFSTSFIYTVAGLVLLSMHGPYAKHTKHIKTLPALFHDTVVMSSGRLPSDLRRPTGSRQDGILAAASERCIMLLMAA